MNTDIAYVDETELLHEVWVAANAWMSDEEIKQCKMSAIKNKKMFFMENC